MTSKPYNEANMAEISCEIDGKDLAFFGLEYEASELLTNSAKIALLSNQFTQKPFKLRVIST